MPRAFCPECAAEVPIDEEGRCFLGHQVPAAASSSSRPDIQDAVEEPEPWVANVTSQDARAPEDEAVAEPSAAAGKATPEDEAAPSTDAGTPRPSEVPSEEEVELDLDTLEQAVAEMGLSAASSEDEFAVFDEGPSEAPSASVPPGTDETEPRRVAPEPAVEPSEPEVEAPEVEMHQDAVADVLDVQGVDAEPTGAEPGTRPEPEPADEDDEPDEWAAFDEPDEGQEPEEPDAEDEPVDTANFLARPKGKRRGLFGR